MSSANLTVAEIARRLNQQITTLAPYLLPEGHLEGNEWRAGSVTGEAGSSLGVHQTGAKAGIWADFATGEAGDALDLVRAVNGLSDTGAALAWARRWLGLDDGAAELSRRPVRPTAPEPTVDVDRWRKPWGAARPIGGTVAETYLARRGSRFDDDDGRVLRFAPRRYRKNPAGEFEMRLALLALLSDARTGKPCGIINIYLLEDGHDRLRDAKGKTVTGRASGAVVMLSAFDEPTTGLILCEGVETGLAIYQSGLRPIWACGSAGTLTTFPLIGGIEALTIAADADPPGLRGAEACADRWRNAGREASIVPPMSGDWAAPC